MFDPDGYLPVQHIVAWVAGLGAQGKLPRRLGFVHPGDSPEFDDLPADAVARHVLGETMAAGTLTAIVIVSPPGDIYPAPASYWRSDGSHETMKDSRMDPRVLGLDPDLNSARVRLHPDAVAAALGLTRVPPDESAAPAPKPPQTRSAAPRGRSYQDADQPLHDEMHARITAGTDATPTDAARGIVHKATGKGNEDSKVKRLVGGYLRKYGPVRVNAPIG